LAPNWIRSLNHSIPKNSRPLFFTPSVTASLDCVAFHSVIF